MMLLQHALPPDAPSSSHLTQARARGARGSVRAISAPLMNNM
jgi:hypothetical protein